MRAKDGRTKLMTILSMNWSMLVPERAFLSFKDVIGQTLGDISRLKLVDIGCGSGSITRKLAQLGATVTGIDPNTAAIEQAQEEEGGPTYRVAHAEELGLPDASCDIAFFSNSLHHVDDMAAALAQAYRIVCPGGRIAVLEPESHDPILPVMRFVDDETVLYEAAQKAVQALAASGGATRDQSLVYAGKFRAGSPQELIDSLIEVDLHRSLDDADRPAFEAAFEAALKSDDEGSYLEHWQRIDVLKRV